MENSTLKKPTLAEYNQAKEDCKMYADSIEMSRERMLELIDELAAFRESEKSCMESYEKCKNIILLYETYEEIEKNHKI